MVTGMSKLLAWGVVFYLEKEVRGVMHQHHQSANSHIVGTVGETNKENGGNVMNYLLLEILEDTETTQREKNVRDLSSSWSVVRDSQIYRFVVCINVLLCLKYLRSAASKLLVNHTKPPYLFIQVATTSISHGSNAF